MSASISLEPQDRSSRIFLCRFPLTVAQSFSGGVAICYVLPVLWTTSRLAVVGRMAMRGKRRFDTGTESDVLVNALLIFALHVYLLSYLRFTIKCKQKYRCQN